jgi:adenosine deaminase
MTDLAAFIAGLPKAELHMHIEGSLEPELMFALAGATSRDPLQVGGGGARRLQLLQPPGLPRHLLSGRRRAPTEEDFRDLAAAYFDRAAADNVVHAEIFFDPQTHTDRGVPSTP